MILQIVLGLLDIALHLGYAIFTAMVVVGLLMAADKSQTESGKRYKEKKKSGDL